MITNSNGDKVSAKEAAKEALALAIKKAAADDAEYPVGGIGQTEKEAAKIREQLDKISARLLAKLVPAE